MIMSNEPGYYKTGDYGIRIENLVIVERPRSRAATARCSASRRSRSRRSISRSCEPALMTADEIAWLNAYHKRVRETLAPLRRCEYAAWLERRDAADLRSSKSAQCDDRRDADGDDAEQRQARRRDEPRPLRREFPANLWRAWSARSRRPAPRAELRRTRRERGRERERRGSASPAIRVK